MQSPIFVDVIDKFNLICINVLPLALIKITVTFLQKYTRNLYFKILSQFEI